MLRFDVSLYMPLNTLQCTVFYFHDLCFQERHNVQHWMCSLPLVWNSVLCLFKLRLNVAGKPQSSQIIFLRFVCFVNYFNMGSLYLPCNTLQSFFMILSCRGATIFTFLSYMLQKSHSNTVLTDEFLEDLFASWNIPRWGCAKLLVSLHLPLDTLQCVGTIFTFEFFLSL